MQCRQGLTLTVWLTVVLVYLITPGEAANVRDYNPADGSRTIIKGRRQYGDQLLYNDRVSSEYKFLRVISTDVFYPPKFERKNINITYFQVLDMYGNNNAGYAFHTAGGVGMGYVGFHIKSKRNHGYDFNIQIYGYKH